MTEIEDVLQYTTDRIIEYVKHADSNEGNIGQFAPPLQLSHELIQSGLTNEGEGLEGLKSTTEWVLKNSVVTWHKSFLEKLYAGNNPIGVASDMLLSVLNTNSHVYTASPALTLIEKYISQKYANQFGFTGEFAGGLTFPGGSYSNITSMQTARSLKFPSSKTEGMSQLKLAVFVSEHAHYSVTKSAILMGLGTNSVFKVKVDNEGCMSISDLENQILHAKQLGYIPFYVNSTAGTTVYGSFDDFNKIADVCLKYDLWHHLDGSWGGNVIFSERHKSKMSGSERANSLTANPHKMLGVPCTCSFLLVPDSRDFLRANALDAEYLFHTNDEDMLDLAKGTMACGRRPDAFKLYMSWKYYGIKHYEFRVDHAYEMTEYLYNKVKTNQELVLVLPDLPPCLQMCFYFAKNGELGTAEENTIVTRRICAELLKSSKFLIDYSKHPEHGEFFRIVVNSPKVDKQLIDQLVGEIIECGRNL